MKSGRCLLVISTLLSTFRQVNFQVYNGLASSSVAHWRSSLFQVIKLVIIAYAFQRNLCLFLNHSITRMRLAMAVYFWHIWKENLQKCIHYLYHVCLPVCLSEYNNLRISEWIFMKFGIEEFVDTLQVRLKLDEDDRYFLWRTRWILDASQAFSFL